MFYYTIKVVISNQSLTILLNGERSKLDVIDIKSWFHDGYYTGTPREYLIYFKITKMFLKRLN